MSLDWKERENLNFLVVDDMVNVRMLLRDMLHHLGYLRVAEADNGITAWNKLNSQNIDIAIVDWNMPHLSGIDLLRRTRADGKLANIPFIMISGEVGDETIAEAAETEVDAYIIKPFVAAILEEKITQVLSRAKSPLPIDILLKKAYAFTQSKQFNKAGSELKKAMTLHPRDPRVSLGFAQLYKQMGLLDEAEKAYKKAIFYEPKFVKAHDGLADLYRNSGEEKKLMTSLREALTISPKNAARQADLGKLCLEMGLADDAKKAFGACLKAEPNNTAVQHKVAEMLMARGMNQEATTFFQAALKAAPEDIHTYNRLGIAFRKQGKYREAFGEYKKAIQIAPHDENLYYNLGRAYLEAGSNEEAVEQFKRALEHNPLFFEAREMLETIEKGLPEVPAASGDGSQG
jgi:tetratricopeptide (TPR) repeat protein